ncbi:uncharacterized protein EAF02_011830 [Botrytis sinoallii]|uniref:uncharacterized protein n=1 Tax=Botrytis sinoallii TaxID=1463999 RepID=UPI001900453F|nr:uncharacterized protein EAF02_011830 [Botrytis sinoallii]KAF7853840.1 hypothetical protein EAF02_011830 [Botrytis sinoallii]
MAFSRYALVIVLLIFKAQHQISPDEPGVMNKYVITPQSSWVHGVRKMSVVYNASVSYEISFESVAKVAPKK